MRQVHIVRIAFDLIPFSARGANLLMLPQRRRLLEGGGGGRLLLFDITIGHNNCNETGSYSQNSIRFDSI